MKMKNRLLAIAALLGTMVLVSGVFAPSASADHAVPTPEATVNDDGTVTIKASWPEPNDGHRVTNHLAPWLIVHVDGDLQFEQLNSDNPVSITVGPFPGDTVVQYRVFGGGESSYHVPSGDWQAVEDWIKGPDGPGTFQDLTAANFATVPVELLAPWEEIQVKGQETGDSGVTAGSYLVPNELAPGLYKTTVPEDEEFGCGVVRYGDTARNDQVGFVFFEANEPGVVEILESDALVDFRGSCVWHLDSSGTGNGTGNGGGGSGGSGDSDDSDGLPVTGSNLILLIIVGMASATLGTIAVVIGRRKGVV